jgi:hypothetical protein
MKARDLAALAALGIAGKYAFDKFGNKKKDATTKDNESESRARMDKRDMNEGSGRRDAGGETVDVDRRAGAPERERDLNEGSGRRDAGGNTEDVDRRAGVPERAKKEIEYPLFPRKKDKETAAEPVVQRSNEDYSNEGRNAKAPVSAQMPDASRVKAYNPDIMYNTTVKSDPNVEHDAEMNRLAQKRATRQGTVVAQTPNAQAQARILRQGPTPAQSATNAQAQARLLRQGAPAAAAAPPAPAAQQSRYTKDKYGNIIDNTTGKVSRTIFSAGQEGNAARVGMKRGGAVKMASGGMTSSKMSKPSGASRGDGIAQRGRTRGKYL